MRDHQRRQEIPRRQTQRQRQAHMIPTAKVLYHLSLKKSTLFLKDG